VPRGDQLIRQWRLLQTLESRPGRNVEELAGEVRCSPRTIWRDLKVLQEAGFPLYDAPDGKRSRWQFVEGYRSSLPVPFTLTELLALHWSRDLLAPIPGTPLRDALDNSLGKIRSLLPAKALAYLEAMGRVVSVRSPRMKLVFGGQDWLTPLHQALQRREQVEIDYYSMSRDELTTRRVDPYHVTHFDGGFYLLGHCHLRHDLRTFAVERIREIRPTGLNFVRPRNFDPEAYFRDSWGIVKGDRLTVHLRFSRGQAKYIAERVWHPSQEIRWLRDGGLDLTLRVADTLELKRWVLGFGREVQVLEPTALRDAIRGEAEALLRQPGAQRRPAIAAPRPVRRPPRAKAVGLRTGTMRRARV